MEELANAIYQTENYGCLQQPKIVRVSHSLIDYAREGGMYLSCKMKDPLTLTINYRKFYGFQQVCFSIPTFTGEISAVKHNNIHTFRYEMSPYIEFMASNKLEESFILEHLGYWVEDFIINPFMEERGILYHIVGRAIIAIMDM